jgi:plastocyanin
VRISLMLATVAVTAALLAGCGSSNGTTTGTTATTATTGATSAPSTTSSTSSSAASSTPAPAPSGAGQALSLAANAKGEFKYEPSSLTATAGSVSIDFTNASPLEHDLTIASSSGTVAGATPIFQGGSKTLTVSLKAGTYKFYCTVPGHRAAGMEGTLTVR